MSRNYKVSKGLLPPVCSWNYDYLVVVPMKTIIIMELFPYLFMKCFLHKQYIAVLHHQKYLKCLFLSFTSRILCFLFKSIDAAMERLTILAFFNLLWFLPSTILFILIHKYIQKKAPVWQSILDLLLLDGLKVMIFGNFTTISWCFLWTTKTDCSSSDPGLCYQCYGCDHYYARNHIDPQSNNHFQAWNPYRSTRQESYWIVQAKLFFTMLCKIHT